MHKLLMIVQSKTLIVWRALDKFEKRSSAKKTKLCQMNVIGLSDKDAIYVLGLDESKVNK